jgi:hypothetical protein
MTVTMLLQNTLEAARARRGLPRADAADAHLARHGCPSATR